MPPLVGGAKGCRAARLQARDAFGQQRLELGGTLQRVVGGAARGQALGNHRQARERAGCQARQVAVVAQRAARQARKFGFVEGFGRGGSIDARQRAGSAAQVGARVLHGWRAGKDQPVEPRSQLVGPACQRNRQRHHGQQKQLHRQGRARAQTHRQRDLRAKQERDSSRRRCRAQDVAAQGFAFVKRVEQGNCQPEQQQVALDHQQLGGVRQGGQLKGQQRYAQAEEQPGQHQQAKLPAGADGVAHAHYQRQRAGQRQDGQEYRQRVPWPAPRSKRPDQRKQWHNAQPPVAIKRGAARPLVGQQPHERAGPQQRRQEDQQSVRERQPARRCRFRRGGARQCVGGQRQRVGGQAQAGAAQQRLARVARQQVQPEPPGQAECSNVEN